MQIMNRLNLILKEIIRIHNFLIQERVDFNNKMIITIQTNGRIIILIRKTNIITAIKRIERDQEADPH